MPQTRFPYPYVRRVRSLALLAGLAIAPPVLAGHAHVDALDDAAHDRFIVTYRDGSTRGALARAHGHDPLAGAARAVPVRRGQALRLSRMRRLMSGPEVVRASRKLDRAEAAMFMRRLAADPAVLRVEVDQRLQLAALPDDPKLPNQWALGTDSAGINVRPAWEQSTGAGTVVAVIDTGVYRHPDLVANLLPGYDFIGDLVSAGDGDGRDADATDVGDWAAAGVCSPGSRDTYSSWHGTHVAGIAAAATHNRLGVAGVGFNAKILPLRVSGKCGAYTSDILDAIDWASGGTVPGVPANPNPAEVINLSMAGVGTCSPSYQAAIDRAVARGSVMVVAAGNHSRDVGSVLPANCQNVVAVAASTYVGRRSTMSNYGAGIDLTAPGQDITSTFVTGAQQANGTRYGDRHGTSMAAPHVAGVVALMQAAAAYPLAPARIEQILKSTARAMPIACPEGCGAGLLDAGAAVAAARIAGQQAPAPAPAPVPTPAPVPAPAPASLPVPLSVEGIAAAQGVSLNYQIDVPAGRTLVVSMEGGTGDADLYVNRGAEPTNTTWLCRPFASVNTERCTIPSPVAARYYIRIHAYRAISGMRFTASY